MPTISIHRPSGTIMGTTHVHEVPRVGEAILWSRHTWRVIDVAHPTEDIRGVGIPCTRVRVRAEEVPWLQ